ncbi:ECF-type sigma factor [Thalassoglobus neptunius]|nr:ECF-type sigma factor [Thalassoglobus neptunius]
MQDVTQVFRLIEAGSGVAASKLLPLVYDELRQHATERMASQSCDHTLQPTALVHEAYVRLVRSEKLGWASRRHFFSAAAEAMRCILIDNARKKACLRHGGDKKRIPAEFDAEIGTSMPCEKLVLLDLALDRLKSEDPKLAEIVRLRFYAGCTMIEIAETLERPLRSVERDWRYARTWLFREISTER